MRDFLAIATRWSKACARGIAWAIGLLAWIVARMVLAGVAITVIVATLIVMTNLLAGVRYNVAFRALDPTSKTCLPDPDHPEPWRILADKGNDENRAADASTSEIDWRGRLRCSIQTHEIPNYQPLDPKGAPIADPKVSRLIYDLAFLEFQEDGEPYLLCNDDDYQAGTCDGTTFKRNESKPETHRGQLAALLERLGQSSKNYIVVFVHGWRNTADLGNGNVHDLRVYAAHAARFVADRCNWGDERYCGMKTTAVFVGWRGARTDEGLLRQRAGRIAAPFCGPEPCVLRDMGDYLGTLAAIFTLFDRKPVSEAVAPSVISALRAIERVVGLQRAFRSEDLAPCDSVPPGPPDPSWTCRSDRGDGAHRQARMIVFGHSLGGNLLAAGLVDQAVKSVELHNPRDFVPPLLGNLVVLLNPASEAANWVKIQRVVWGRIATSSGDQARENDFEKGHAFFRDEQRPVFISATAARDWPPDGIWGADCADLARMAQTPDRGDFGPILREYEREAERRSRSIEYDWATYDLFPAFRFDFRPVASSLERYAQRRPGGEIESGPYGYLFDACSSRGPSNITGWLAHFAGAALRVFPFMNTDVMQSRTIGHLDPPRASESIMSNVSDSPWPFGTTHQLVGWNPGSPAAERSADNYVEVAGPKVQCPVATGWLSKARAFRKVEDPSAHEMQWDAADVKPGDGRPALRFEHGYYPTHLQPITLGNDPFWNLRALDNTLAEHDGYMLSSFICAMQQLVLDDITDGPTLPTAQTVPGPSK
jgi:hypothetical protein